MITTARRALLRLILASAFFPVLVQAQPQTPLPAAELFIETAKGRQRFMVELADTDERRMIGLMHRNSLATDAGMLFDFKTDQPIAMWMRNTRIPLDMLFIARDGRVVNIAERAVPFSEQTIPSSGPVRAVLELAGGTASRLGIKPGDRVVHPMFRNAG
jgi:hypothetical protein